MTKSEREIALKIPLLTFKNYLEINEWKMYGTLGDKASLWKKRSKIILLPSQKDFLDYERRLIELINDLKDLEQQTISSILEDILLTKN